MKRGRRGVRNNAHLTLSEQVRCGKIKSYTIVRGAGEL